MSAQIVWTMESTQIIAILRCWIPYMHHTKTIYKMDRADTNEGVVQLQATYDISQLPIKTAAKSDIGHARRDLSPKFLCGSGQKSVHNETNVYAAVGQIFEIQKISLQKHFRQFSKF